MNSTDFDLHSLQLFHRVAHHRSFTKAAKEAGLSQSALSRQITSLEARIGVPVFERTTRSVKITEAGAVLLRETASIPNILRGALRRIHEDYLDQKPEIHLAISTDLSLAHIPGLFGSKPCLDQHVQFLVSQYSENELLEKLCETKYDLGILACPSKLPALLKITHRMSDQFVVVTPSSTNPPNQGNFKQWADQQNWILPPAKSSAGKLITDSLGKLAPSMELENFDLMLQFVSLKMGCSIVPRRSISLFPNKSLLTKINPPTPITRELIVVSPLHRKPTLHIQSFIDGILFS